MTLVPTFVAFHPWTTLESYCDLLDVDRARALVDHVAPIQLAIRLLIPQGSRMLELEEVRAGRRAVRSEDADLPLGPSPIRASTPARGGRRSWSAAG